MLSAWDFIRRGAIVSVLAHAVFAAGALGLFAHPKLFEATSEPLMVDIVSPKDVPQLDTSKFDVPEFDTAETKGQKPEGGPREAKAAQSRPPDAKSAPQAAPAKAEQQVARAEPLAAKPEPPGQATFTPVQPTTPQSIFAPTQIPALLDLVAPATSEGLAPLAEVQADIAADDISAFKAHLRKCWSPPAGLAADGKLKVTLRVFLAPNGTLAQQPVLMAATASPSGPALVQSATAAMRRCAPFNFLPADRYKEWKVLDVSLSAADMGGG